MSAQSSITIICSLLSALGVGGIIGGIVSAKIRRMDIKQEEREEARVKEFQLMYLGVRVGGNLAKQSALALRQMKVNGPLDKALTAYEDYEKERDKYFEEQTAKAIHGG